MDPRPSRPSSVPLDVAERRYEEAFSRWDFIFDTFLETDRTPPVNDKDLRLLLENLMDSFRSLDMAANAVISKAANAGCVELCNKIKRQWRLSIISMKKAKFISQSSGSSLWDDLKGNDLDLTARMSPDSFPLDPENQNDIGTLGHAETTQVEVHAPMYPSLENISHIPDNNDVTHPTSRDVKNEYLAPNQADTDQAASLAWDYSGHPWQLGSHPVRPSSVPVVSQPVVVARSSSADTHDQRNRVGFLSKACAASTPHINPCARGDARLLTPAELNASRPHSSSRSKSRSGRKPNTTAHENPGRNLDGQHAFRSRSKKRSPASQPVGAYATPTGRISTRIASSVHPVVFSHPHIQTAVSVPQTEAPLPQSAFGLQHTPAHTVPTTANFSSMQFASHQQNQPGAQHIPWLLSRGAAHYLPPHAQHSMLCDPSAYPASTLLGMPHQTVVNAAPQAGTPQVSTNVQFQDVLKRLEQAIKNVDSSRQAVVNTPAANPTSKIRSWSNTRATSPTRVQSRAPGNPQNVTHPVSSAGMAQTNVVNSNRAPQQGNPSLVTPAPPAYQCSSSSSTGGSMSTVRQSTTPKRNQPLAGNPSNLQSQSSFPPPGNSAASHQQGSLQAPVHPWWLRFRPKSPAIPVSSQHPLLNDDGLSYQSSRRHGHTAPAHHAASSQAATTPRTARRKHRHNRSTSSSAESRHSSRRSTKRCKTPSGPIRTSSPINSARHQSRTKSSKAKQHRKRSPSSSSSSCARHLSQHSHQGSKKSPKTRRHRQRSSSSSSSSYSRPHSRKSCQGSKKSSKARRRHRRSSSSRSPRHSRHHSQSSQGSTKSPNSRRHRKRSSSSSSSSYSRHRRHRSKSARRRRRRRSASTSSATSSGRSSSSSRHGSKGRARSSYRTDSFLLHQLLDGTSRSLRFKGVHHTYRRWKRDIKSRLRLYNIRDEQTIIDVLASNCEGEPHKAIADIDDVGHRRPKQTLKEIWRRLDETYGNDAEPIERVLNEIREFKPISDAENEANLKALIKLSQICQKIKVANLDSRDTHHFTSQIGIKSLVEKTPPRFQQKWRDFVVSREEKGRKATLEHFDDKLSYLIKVRSHPLYKKSSASTSTKALATSVKSSHENGTKTSNISATHKPNSASASSRPSASSANVDAKTWTCVIHGERSLHPTTECKAFAKLKIYDRGEAVKKSSCCLRCFSPTHSLKDCKKNIKCSHCQRTNHHSLLCFAAANQSGTAHTGQSNSTVKQPSEHNARNASRNKPTSEASATSSTVVNKPHA